MAPFALWMSFGAAPYAHHEKKSARAWIEEMIETLIGMLDDLDGDPDAEFGADGEPSLGWSVTMATGSNDDREADGADLTSTWSTRTREWTP